VLQGCLSKVNIAHRAWATRLQAAVAIVDISGFTALAEALCSGHQHDDGEPGRLKMGASFSSSFTEHGSSSSDMSSYVGDRRRFTRVQRRSIHAPGSLEAAPPPANLASNGGVGEHVGTEKLQAILDSYFAALIELISASGGDVLRIAGDALICLYSAQEDMSHAMQQRVFADFATISAPSKPAGHVAAAQAGAAAAYAADLPPAEVHARLVSVVSSATAGLLGLVGSLDKTLVEGHTLRLHVGVGAGTVTMFHLGGHLGRWEFTAVGPPLRQIASALNTAKAGQLALSREAADFLRSAGDAHLFSFVSSASASGACSGGIGDEGDVVVCLASASGDGVSAGVEACRPGAEGEAAALPVLSKRKELLAQPEGRSRHTEVALRAYVPITVLTHVDAAREGWNAELRHLSVLFIKLTNGPLVDLCESKEAVSSILMPLSSAPADGGSSAPSSPSMMLVSQKGGFQRPTASILSRRAQGSFSAGHGGHGAGEEEEYCSIAFEEDTTIDLSLGAMDPAEAAAVKAHESLQRAASTCFDTGGQASICSGAGSELDELDKLSRQLLQVQLAAANGLVSVIQSSLYAEEAVIKELTVDDKGCVVVAGFGVPPFFYHDSGARACRAALALSARLRAAKFECCMGITTGSAFCSGVGHPEIRREFAIIGAVVNLAARLMASSSNLGILVDAETAESARKNVSFEEPALTIHVKGKPEPVQVFRPLKMKVHPRVVKCIVSASRGLGESRRRGSAAGMHPLRRKSSMSCPALAAVASSAVVLAESALRTMVGRVNERAALRGRVSELMSGFGGTVIISGAAGMGKTILSSEIISAADACGVLCLTASGEEDGTKSFMHFWRVLLHDMLSNAAGFSITRVASASIEGRRGGLYQQLVASNGGGALASVADDLRPLEDADGTAPVAATFAGGTAAVTTTAHGRASFLRRNSTSRQLFSGDDQVAQSASTFISPDAPSDEAQSAMAVLAELIVMDHKSASDAELLRMTSAVKVSTVHLFGAILQDMVPSIRCSNERAILLVDACDFIDAPSLQLLYLLSNTYPSLLVFLACRSERNLSASWSASANATLGAAPPAQHSPPSSPAPAAPPPAAASPQELALPDAVNFSAASSTVRATIAAPAIPDAAAISGGLGQRTSMMAPSSSASRKCGHLALGPMTPVDADALIHSCVDSSIDAPPGFVLASYVSFSSLIPVRALYLSLTFSFSRKIDCERDACVGDQHRSRSHGRQPSIYGRSDRKVYLERPCSR
jgi:class 3 adenylate cyclase